MKNEIKMKSGMVQGRSHPSCRTQASDYGQVQQKKKKNFYKRMDGQYQNKMTLYTNIMLSWINEMIEGRLWEKFNDIHIDEIEPNIKNRKKIWFDFSINLFNNTYALIDNDIFDLLLVS